MMCLCAEIAVLPPGTLCQTLQLENMSIARACAAVDEYIHRVSKKTTMM